MDRIEIKAHAKINLSLDVLNKRNDGYHNVNMIMQTVELSDKVIINRIDKGIKLNCNKCWIPTDFNNIAYKAAKLLIDECKINSGVDIEIEKNIPVSAGLAGGSTDAAAVLCGMNVLFSLKLTSDDLIRLGVRIGADVPYCTKGGTMNAQGIGEKLTKLKQLPSTDILIIKPHISVPTGWVYDNLQINDIKGRPDIERLIKNIENNEIELLAKNMVNVLETVTVIKYPIVQTIKYMLIKQGAIGSIMSGSGPSVYGIFNNESKARSAQYKIMQNKLLKNKCESFITKTC